MTQKHPEPKTFDAAVEAIKGARFRIAGDLCICGDGLDAEYLKAACETAVSDLDMQARCRLAGAAGLFILDTIAYECFSLAGRCNLLVAAAVVRALANVPPAAN